MVIIATRGDAGVNLLRFAVGHADELDDDNPDVSDRNVAACPVRSSPMVIVVVAPDAP